MGSGTSIERKETGDCARPETWELQSELEPWQRGPKTGVERQRVPFRSPQSIIRSCGAAFWTAVWRGLSSLSPVTFGITDSYLPHPRRWPLVSETQRPEGCCRKRCLQAFTEAVARREHAQRPQCFGLWTQTRKPSLEVITSSPMEPQCQGRLMPVAREMLALLLVLAFLYFKDLKGSRL